MSGGSIIAVAAPHGPLRLGQRTFGRTHGNGRATVFRLGLGSPIAPAASIGIGGHLAMPPLPHHRAYGSVPRRFGGLSIHQFFPLGAVRDDGNGLW